MTFSNSRAKTKRRIDIPTMKWQILIALFCAVAIVSAEVIDTESDSEADEADAKSIDENIAAVQAKINMLRTHLAHAAAGLHPGLVHKLSANSAFDPSSVAKTVKKPAGIDVFVHHVRSGNSLTRKIMRLMRSMSADNAPKNCKSAHFMLKGSMLNAPYFTKWDKAFKIWHRRCGHRKTTTTRQRCVKLYYRLHNNVGKKTKEERATMWKRWGATCLRMRVSSVATLHNKLTKLYRRAHGLRRRLGRLYRHKISKCARKRRKTSKKSYKSLNRACRRKYLGRKPWLSSRKRGQLRWMKRYLRKIRSRVRRTRGRRARRRRSKRRYRSRLRKYRKYERVMKRVVRKGSRARRHRLAKHRKDRRRAVIKTQKCRAKCNRTISRLRKSAKAKLSAEEKKLRAERRRKRKAARATARKEFRTKKQELLKKLMVKFVPSTTTATSLATSTGEAQKKRELAKAKASIRREWRKSSLYRKRRADHRRMRKERLRNRRKIKRKMRRCMRGCKKTK